MKEIYISDKIVYLTDLRPITIREKITRNVDKFFNIESWRRAMAMKREAKINRICNKVATSVQMELQCAEFLLAERITRIIREELK